MSRNRHPSVVQFSKTVLNVLPEFGQEPINCREIAKRTGMLSHPVSLGLQVLKAEGLAINPRGPRTNYWTRTESEWVGTEVSENPEEDTLYRIDPRQLELDLNPVEAQVNETSYVTREEFGRALELLEAIAWHLGVEPQQEGS